MPLIFENMLGMCAQNRLLMLLGNSLRFFDSIIAKSSKVIGHLPLENENMLGICAQNQLLTLLQNSLRFFDGITAKVFCGLPTYAPGK